jgi:hypothetical protein
MASAAFYLGLVTTTLAQSPSLYDLSAIDINGKEVSLDFLRGNFSMVMNVATF